MWTYSGDPSKSPLDAVRFLIGDTDENDPLLNDAEIQYTLYHGVVSAAIQCCDIIAAKFLREVDYAIGPLRESASQKANAYMKRANYLRKNYKKASYPVWQNPFSDPAFARNMMSNNTG